MLLREQQQRARVCSHTGTCHANNSAEQRCCPRGRRGGRSPPCSVGRCEMGGDGGGGGSAPPPLPPAERERAARVLLCTHALATWGWRSWEFAAAILLSDLFPSASRAPQADCCAHPQPSDAAAAASAGCAAPFAGPAAGSLAVVAAYGLVDDASGVLFGGRVGLQTLGDVAHIFRFALFDEGMIGIVQPYLYPPPRYDASNGIHVASGFLRDCRIRRYAGQP